MAQFAEIKKFLQHVSDAPAPDTEDRQLWLEGRDSLSFLRRSVTDDVPVLAVTPQFFLYAVLLPIEHLGEDYREAFLQWHANAGRTWNIMAGRDRDTGDAYGVLHAPHSVSGASLFDDAEPVVFIRHFARGAGDGQYIEANQKVAQSARLHRIDDRQAYSRLDEFGDFQDVIRFGDVADGHFCTMNAEFLDRYLFATNQALVRLFRIDRCGDWPQCREFREVVREETAILDEAGLYAERTIRVGPSGADDLTLLGAQVVLEVGDRQKHLARLLGEDAEANRIASFLVGSGEDGKVMAWPPDGKGATGGEQGFAPHPITPTFFNPEVLSRFKRDPDKYILTQSTIECRGAWFLRSYDVNEAGQVYAYLKDLWDLPYREQLYWAGFNQPTRAGITERSWMHDFLAQWWDGVDPLIELQRVLRSFPAAKVGGQPVAIWVNIPGDPDRALHRLHYVLTDSPDEWGSHVLELGKVVVEGLDKKSLKQIARKVGIEDETIRKAGSIKLLEGILRAKGLDGECVNAICSPLYEVYELRSHSGVAHRGNETPKGDLRQHFRDLVTSVSGSMQQLSALISAGFMDVN